jgi:predicted Zn finger-like uncharacterized protein
MQFACPSCQKQLRVPDASVGKKVRCPSCAAVIPVLASAEQIQAESPLRDVTEKKSPPPLPMARHQEEEPRSRRRRDDDDEDIEESREERRPRREDDDDDLDDIRADRMEARRRGKAAARWFLAAGIISLVMVTLSLASNFYMSLRFGDAGPRPNDAFYNMGRIAGMAFCGVVGIIGAVFQFQASAGLRSCTRKGAVITAIVFGFVFGVLFGIGVLVNLALF